MKKFLPLLPAFLLCFAGGMNLRPVPADQTKSLQATCVLAELPDSAGSYSSWVQGQKNIDQGLKTWEANNRAYNDSLVEQEKAQKLIELIDQNKNTLNANLKQITWCNEAMNQNQQSFTELETNFTQLKTISERIAKGHGEAFKVRVDLYRQYKQSLKQYLKTSSEQKQKVTDWYRAHGAPEK